jgi:hypothetical protein
MRGNGECVDIAGENWASESVDCEHGSGMDLFGPAPTTYSVTQVGYVMLIMYKRIINTSPLMYVQIMMQEKLTLFFPLQVKNKPHDDVQFVCSFFNKVWWQTPTSASTVL